MEEKKLIKFVSIYRFIALLIVLYYHLVIIPTHSLEVTAVINGSLESPITPENVLAKAGMYIYYMFHTDTGSLAVTMFFIASGYLASHMMDRYSRKEYLVNRALSTFPTLWVSIGIIAIFVYLSQAIVFTPADILSSAFPFWPHTSGMFVSAVLWTLRVEMKFYILATIFGKNRKELILYGYILILFLTIVGYEFQVPMLYNQMYDMQYIGFILLGMVIEYVQRNKCKNGLAYVCICVISNILIFKISSWLFQDSASRMSYPSVTTQVFPVILFLALYKIQQIMPSVYDHIPKFVYSVSKLLLPLYLTHVACGITIMYQMSLAGFNTYLILLGGVATSFVVAGIIYLLVTKPSLNLMRKVIVSMRSKP